MRGWKSLVPVALILVLVALAGLGCSDDGTSPNTGRIDVGMFYVPDKAIMFDNLNIFNAAGQKYSITNFKYFLSKVRFSNSGGGAVHATDDIHLFNVRSQDSNYDDFISFFNVPAGTYNRISFTFGLDETQNVNGGLPPLAEYNSMVWPDSLGGGYHYMMLEGLWIADKDTTVNGNAIAVGDTLGYATHTGRLNGSPNFFTVTLDLVPALTLKAGETWRIPIAFDTRKWYASPNLYRFPWMPFIMNDPVAQTRLKENGMAYGANELFLAGTPVPQPFATN